MPTDTLGIALTLCFLELRSDTYTAEDAIEHMGLGCFQWKVIIFSCMSSVCHWSVLVNIAVKFTEFISYCYYFSST